MVAYKVKLTYFKLSGKYYSEGEYSTSRDSLAEIWDWLEDTLDLGVRPGLVDGPRNEFHVLVEVPEHPHNHPKLFIAR